MPQESLRGYDLIFYWREGKSIERAGSRPPPIRERRDEIPGVIGYLSIFLPYYSS
jgi:hypothetical protein